MEASIRRIDRELIHKGRILTLYKDTMESVNGHISHFDTLEHMGAAAVVPVLENGNILMVRQFRNPISDFVLEIPAGGKKNKEEDSKLCALRELEEETGFKASDAEFLVRLGSAYAYCNEILDVYVARNLKKGEQNWDEDEFIEVEEWKLDDLCELIYKGEISDSKTVAAIMAYKNKYVN